MFKNKKKLNFYGLSSALILLGLLLVLITSTAIGAVSAILVIDKTEQFEYTYSGHSFMCYTLQDEDHNPVSGVAISLNENADTTTETTLNIPETVNDGTNNYTVRAIAPGAFRYTKFKQFNLPLTIEQIGEEAFAYCQKLTSFDMPYLVEEIAPSTFLDCRKLEKVYFLDSAGNRKFGYENEQITTIGDHAFDSCVSLKDFYCPAKVTYFGESSFRKCTSLVNFYFPSTIRDENTNEITNFIKIRPYAFADCSSLIFIYFETNVSEIDNYAFVDCNSTCQMKYNGTAIPTYSKEGVSQTHWRDTNIATNITTLIPLEIKHPTIHYDPDYPCIRYTIESSIVYLDSAKGRRPTVKVIDETEAAESYAVIYKFDLPSETINGCFNVTTGALTIPDELGGKYVKVIRESTFANNSTIKSVTFNEHLVQICNNAFYNCLNIGTLDFNQCDYLREVSYFAFQNATLKNEKLSSLVLPNCLEYVGDYSFANFVNVNDFHISSNMKAIADLAFYNLGYNKSGVIDLVLPRTLNDAAAAEANFYHQKSPLNYEHKDYTRWYAVGKYAFNQAKCLRSVTMEADPGHIDDDSYTCSFFSNAFKDATNLVSFRTGTNSKYLGKDLFKGCTSLREVFLGTAKADTATEDYPWCIDEDTGKYGGTFFTGTSAELVIYLDGPSAPGQLENYTLTADSTSNWPLGHKWNVETTDAYINEMKYVKNNQQAWNHLTRSHIPTFYNVDFDNGIVYWDPVNKVVKTNRPKVLSDYNDGVISLVKGADNNYSVARYFCDGSHGTDIVDLTIIPNVSDHLTVIGPEAFAKSGTLGSSKSGGSNSDRKGAPGLYFILPDTITTISERAFYRKTSNDGAEENNGRFGARVVTYKDTSTGKYIDSDGTTGLTYNELNAKFTTINGQTDKLRRGYCVLPNAVTTIERDAFYNHIFTSVKMGDNISFIGSSAFYIHTVTGGSGTTYGRSTLESISLGTNSIFEVTSDMGLYYIAGGNNKRILLSQGTKNGETSLEIEEHTKAIGFEGCADTNYTSIDLPSGMTTIYGAGLFGNTKLTTITGGEGLKYIGALENASNGAKTTWDDPAYSEVFDSTVAQYTSNTDYRDYPFEPRKNIESTFGAVMSCKSLTTIDFTAMTDIRKIGRSAFENDVKMANMCGTRTYTYKQYNASTGVSTVISGGDHISSGVLDLSACTHLRSIDRSAFRNCTSIKFFHLPDNKTSSDTQSTLYISLDPEIKDYADGDQKPIFSDSAGIKILLKETADYASGDYGTKKPKDHYPTGCFGNNNTVYYYVGQRSDIPTNDSSTLKYWTLDSNGDYILINSAKDARVYFPAS